MIELVTSNSEAKALAKDFKKAKVLSSDTETEGFDRRTQKMCLLQLGNDRNQYLIDVSKVDIQIFKPILESADILKIFHNGLFDTTWLKHEHGIRVQNVYDTMNGEKIMLGVVLPLQPPAGWTKAKLESFKPKYSAALAYCLERRNLPNKFEFELFTYGKPLTDQQIMYSARDIEYLEVLRDDQVRTITQLNLNNVLELENLVFEVFTDMATTGFYIDTNGWADYAKENEAIYNRAVKGLAKISGINWNAPGQVCKFFGVKYIAELEDYTPPANLKKAYQLWRDARAVKKLVDTFGMTWLEKNVHNSIVYCDYTQIVNTGRCSSDSPNLQNIPVKNGAKNRSFFKPRKKSNVFCIADFSSQELAIMAIGSGEPVWLETLRAGGDLHQKCADLMTKVSGKEIPRRMAKTLNFTMGYGGGASTVCLRLKQDYDIKITEDEAWHLINIYFKTFPRLKKWLDANGQSAIVNGRTYSFEPFNRLRVLALEEEDWRKKNIGKNSPVQGTGADMTKLAMVYLHRELKAKLEAHAFIVHQLHDELVVECTKGKAEKCKQIMIESMTKACTMILGEPLSLPEVKIKNSWAKND